MMEVVLGVSVGVPLSCGSWVAKFSSTILLIILLLQKSDILKKNNKVCIHAGVCIYSIVTHVA